MADGSEFKEIFIVQRTTFCKNPAPDPNESPVPTYATFEEALTKAKEWALTFKYKYRVCKVWAEVSVRPLEVDVELFHNEGE